MPITGRLRGKLDSEIAKLIFPLTQPVVEGAKTTLTSILCPAANTIGMIIGGTLNSELLAPIAEMLTLVCPLLVSETSCVSVWPIDTCPKRRLLGQLVSAADPACTSGGTRLSRTATLMIATVKERRERERIIVWGGFITSPVCSGTSQRKMPKVNSEIGKRLMVTMDLSDYPKGNTLGKSRRCCSAKQSTPP